jgi:hypothetical protein
MTGFSFPKRRHASAMTLRPLTRGLVALLLLLGTWCA